MRSFYQRQRPVSAVSPAASRPAGNRVWRWRIGLGRRAAQRSAEGGRRAGQRGSVATFVAIVMLLLLGFTALVVDMGLLYEHRRQLQNAADSAALAAAQELKPNPGGVVAVARDYAGRNGAGPGEITAVQTTRINGSGVDNGVRISLERNVDLLFAPVLGIPSGRVRANAVGIVSPIQPVKIWPFAVPERMLEEPGPIVLKYGSPGSSEPGNFGLLDINGSGAKSVREYIRNGYNGPVPGPIPPNTWLLDTQTGNEARQLDTVQELLNAPACAYPGHDLRCPRYGLVPIVTNESMDACHGKCTVTVRQFAVFRVTGFNEVKGGRGHMQIMGQWIEWAWGINHSERVGGPLVGALGVRLWE